MLKSQDQMDNCSWFFCLSSALLFWYVLGVFWIVPFQLTEIKALHVGS